MTENKITRARVGQMASVHLRGITPSQVDAWRTASEADPVSARALLALVLEVSAHDHPDVTEHAAITAASFLTGATDARMAARAAVVNARRTVALAGEAAAWDMYGDMTDEAAAWDMGAHSTLSQWGTAPADGIARTVPADVTDAAVASVDGARRVSLARAVEDMRAHDEDTCERCHPGAGRRVSLTGITAHVEGWTGEDSAYHAVRRHTVAALASVDREAVLAAMGGAPLASVPRHSRVTGGDRTPRTSAPAPVLTVTARDGSVTVRNVSEAETVALAAVTRADEARHAGEEYGVTSAPYASAQADTFGAVAGKSWVDTGEGATPAVSPNARVRSHKVPVSPRKRAAGNTGPTVPARLSH